jgi:hypothetical protein
MAVKNKNNKNIIKRIEEQEVVSVNENLKEENEILEPIIEDKKETTDNNIKNEMASLKKALFSVYNRLHVYVTKDYVNSKNNNFIESNELLGFKNEKEQIIIKAELINANKTYCEKDNLSIIIKKDNKVFNDYCLLEKTTLEKSNRIVFKTTQTDSCSFQITFILKMENGEEVLYTEEVKYMAYNRVMVGYFNRHTKRYEIIENNDIKPTSSCKGNTYEIKFYKLPNTKENHGERICLYIPYDVHNNDKGEYSFKFNGFQVPLFFEEKTIFNNEEYYIYLSTSYYENDNNEISDFSIKITVE